ncbi:hypothetical protein CSC88_35015, partial [Klebsiella pneumoniae]
MSSTSAASVSYQRQVHQTRYASGDFRASVTFNDKFTSCFTQNINSCLRQLTYLNIFSEARIFASGFSTGF